MTLRLRPFKRADLSLLGAWLAEPHVEQWWREDPDPAAVEARYGPAVSGDDPTELFVVELDGQAIGFAQRYLLRDNPSWERPLAGTGIPAGSAGIDYLIGVPSLIGQGLGPQFIDQLVADTFARYPSVTAVVTNVDPENRPSWRALERAGFARTWTGDIEDPADPGPSHVYVRHRVPWSPLAAHFFTLHHLGVATPLLMPNPWDIGSARLLASMGFEALATTSSGCAAAVGRLDGSVSRDEALAHGAALAGATSLPVSADLENGFAEDPAGVAETIGLACSLGLAGASIEDARRDRDDPVYDVGLAVERVAAAAEAAHTGPAAIVLTARAENYLYHRPDLADTIDRLQRYQEAGADVLFAPGLRTIEDISHVVASVDRPVSVLAHPQGPTVAELGAVGVRRISVGGTFAFVALGAVVEAARELMESGTYSYAARAQVGRQQAQAAFGDR